MAIVHTRSRTSEPSPVVHRVTELMAAEGLDALLVQSTENTRYLIGHPIQSQALNMRHRTFLTVLAPDGRCALLASRAEVPDIEENALGVEIISYDEFSDDLSEVMRAALEAAGISGGRVGAEQDSLTLQVSERVRTLLPGAELVPALNLLDTARAIKSEPEIAAMRQAASYAVRAQEAMYEVVEAGWTEREAATFLVGRLLDEGADGYKTVQVAAGPRSQLANPSPGDVALGSGQPVKVDLFPTVAGYLSDTGRTFSIGSATPALRAQWAAAEDVLATMAAFIQPGMTGGAVWSEYLQQLVSLGLEPAMQFLGHGLGLGLHEAPFIAPGSSQRIQPGMVLALEPVTTLDGVGLHIENVYQVTDSGLVNLTDGYAVGYRVA